eukprot:jgi/Psemu1/319999/estExt_fgenesh1_pm.C_3580003
MHENIQDLVVADSTGLVVVQKHHHFRQHEERPRIRSLFSVPGADKRKIQKAQTLGADAVVLDLEDGVAHDRKDEARELVTETLLDANQSFGNSELCVRVNGLHTEHAIRDLEAVLPCPQLQSIVLPKVESQGDILFVARMIEEYCLGAGSHNHRDVRILAAIESAKGFLNLREIAETAARERHGQLLPLVEGLVFASEDYCADIEAIRTPDAKELLYARSQIVITAKAYGLQAIDMVHINFRDLDELASECEAGKQLGFTGKQAIHPSQVAIIHEQFSPSSGDAAFAARVVAAFEAIEAVGRGACVVDGIAVDLPVYKWAVKICKQVEREAQR